MKNLTDLKMREYKNRLNTQNYCESKSRFIILLSLIVSLIASSCSVVSGIFKAGMDFGIFIVIAIIVIIVYTVMRLRRKK